MRKPPPNHQLTGPPCPVVMLRNVPPAVHYAVRMFARREHVTIGEAYAKLVGLGFASLATVSERPEGTDGLPHPP